MPLLLLAALVLVVLALRELHAASRRRAERRRGGRRISERLSDPREAAAVLLVQQAVYEGHVSVEQKQTILALMREQFDSDAAEAEGLFSFGRMAVGQAGDAANSLRRLLAPIREACTLQEMKDLVAMLEQVGAVSGPLNEHQVRLISETRRALSLPEPA